MRAVLTAVHLPATTTLSRDPHLTKRCVAPPLRKEYGLKSHLVNLSLETHSEKVHARHEALK